MRILHLSDPHIPRRPGRDEDGVDARAILARLLDDVRHVPGIDVVLVTGDVADDGSVEGYRGARELVGAFAAQRGVPQLYCPGNHDDRDAFATVLGSGHLDAAGADTGRSLVPGAERAAVAEVGGYRFVTLDSLVPGEVHGRVSPAQLAALGALLEEPAPAGTVVALHHPPVALDLEAHRQAGLQDAQALAAVVEGSDVQAVLCGHFHLQLSGRLAGIPVWVTPGIVTRIDLTAPVGVERAVIGAGASVVDLGQPGSPLFHLLQSRDPEAGRQVYLADGATGADLDEEVPVPSPAG